MFQDARRRSYLKLLLSITSAQSSTDDVGHLLGRRFCLPLSWFTLYLVLLYLYLLCNVFSTYLYFVAKTKNQHDEKLPPRKTS